MNIHTDRSHFVKSQSALPVSACTDIILMSDFYRSWMCSSFTCEQTKLCMPLGVKSKTANFLFNCLSIFIFVVFCSASAVAFVGCAPVWYLRLQSLWDAGSHVLYIYLALWFINSLPSMRSTKNTDRGRATTCSIKAWEGSVWRLSGDLST